MATYLVTGAGGFIGSALVRALLERGHTVRGLDNFATGNRENLAEVRSRIDLRQADLLDPAALSEACRGADYVLHQAAIPSVPKSIADPVTSHRVNANGTLALLVAARDAKVKRVVYASSSSIYGDSPTLPKHEGMPPNPISPYAVAKLTGELYAISFYRVYGLETVSLRYFNIFGPRQDANSEYSAALAKFITLMLGGEQPTIFGDGTQSRDFTFVADVVEANLLAAGAAPQDCGRTYNVARGDRTTLIDLALAVTEAVGGGPPPRHVEPRPGDVAHSQADSSRARKAFGFVADVSLPEGLTLTAPYFRSLYSTERTRRTVRGHLA